MARTTTVPVRLMIGLVLAGGLVAGCAEQGTSTSAQGAGSGEQDAGSVEQDAGSVEDQGGLQLLAVVHGVQRSMLTVRSRDPQGSVATVVQDLRAEIGVEPHDVWADDDGTIHLVAPIAMEEVDADGSYGDEVLGACLEVTATAGDADGDVGARGTVTTQQVGCPDDVVPVRGEREADRLVEGIPTLTDDVPMPIEEPGVCFGTSGDCPGG